jgi:hypothetical protein
MATYTGTRAASGFPVFTPNGSGLLCAAYGSYALSANVSGGDIFKLCKLPKGAVVVGGAFWTTDLDTNATETFDMDVGWADNGAEAASSNGFVNSGVMAGDAVTDLIAAGNNHRPFPMSSGPLTFTRETTVQAQAVAAAATFASGTIFVVVYYVVP